MTNKPLVGVDYYAGWWRELPNKWNTRGRDWRLDYPERIPILGMYNDQATADAELQAAGDYGVDFFPVLWYYPKPEIMTEGGALHLNDGLKYMLASPFAGRSRFYVEFCNHPPFGVETAEEWELACQVFLEAMKHPSYLRIGGKPVLKVHGYHLFLTHHGMDKGAAKADLDLLRQRAREAGLGELLIGAGVMARDFPADPEPIVDFWCTYMDVPDLPQKPDDYPWEPVLELARQAWEGYSASASLPYVPYLPAGWNPRPWGDPRACFSLPNAQQWEGALSEMKTALASLSNLGFPLPDGALQPAFTIYAWNEFGEGGFVAPTVGDGYMKLEGIKRVFGGGR